MYEIFTQYGGSPWNMPASEAERYYEDERRADRYEVDPREQLPTGFAAAAELVAKGKT